MSITAWSVQWAQQVGFTGFLPVAALRESRLAEVPELRGVYLVYRADRSAPRFLTASTAGWFKGRDPSLPLTELHDRWVHDAPLLYIGKAGSSTTRSTLRTRLRAYLSSGAGRRAAHWGGRMIWQLADAERLLVAWRVVLEQEPRQLEKQLIQAFRDDCGCWPFANRAG